ncbi:tetratricopeptide repeat protein [Halomonas sp. M4R1S46]|uniref:tetratricopeptide repeat protein n=1 Tax=Halomonas sp. M4R1S46 TaxID=2982692 RepID=UPI0021E3D646|nr:tetratricopeptide repeat protein [Halomonas sp. M4R1S46]UYG07066.1 sel1 repeat family protein [Halomonas sp. M4R1S46]
MRLYGLGISAETIPYLEPAAEAGDVEAMYYLGEVHRLRHMGLTEEAMDWYLKAAERGDPYAMLRLFQGGACIAGDECAEDAEGWREKALAETLPKAEDGNTQAMYALNYVYRALDEDGEARDWLQQAAEEGNPAAQTRLGKYILDGQGWYFLESRRLEAAEAWFRKAAEQRYVPAMAQLSNVSVRLEEYDQAWKWMIEASRGGHVDKRLGEGWCYLEPDRDEKCRVEQDKIKGWAILTAMEQETGLRAAERVLEWNEDELNDRQKHEAEALGSVWKVGT